MADAMKNTLTIVSFICFCLISLTSSSQSINLTELLNLKNLKYEEFETTINQKGYQYLNSTEDDDITTYEFLYKGPNSLIKKYILYTVLNDNRKVQINYRTSLASEYKSLKSDAVKAGFFYKGSGQLDNEKKFYITYSKGTIELKFLSMPINNEYNQPNLYYEILVY